VSSDKGDEPLLSIIVPVHNENRLKTVVEKFMARPLSIAANGSLLMMGPRWKPEILRSLQAQHAFRLLEQMPDREKAPAVARAIREARDVIIHPDAGFRNDPNEIPSVIQRSSRHKADVVYAAASRKTAAPGPPHLPLLCQPPAHPAEQLVFRHLSNDMETCYRVSVTDLVKAMNLDLRRFGIEVERRLISQDPCERPLLVNAAPQFHSHPSVSHGGRTTPSSPGKDDCALYTPLYSLYI